MVLGAATVATASMMLLATVVLATLLDARLRAARIHHREQRALFPLLRAIRSSTSPTRHRAADDPPDVWTVVAPGLGPVTLVRAGPGEGALVYEGPPGRARRMWDAGEERARAWAKREAERIRTCGGFSAMLAASRLDERAAEAVGRAR